MRVRVCARLSTLQPPDVERGAEHIGKRSARRERLASGRVSGEIPCSDHAVTRR